MVFRIYRYHLSPLSNQTRKIDIGDSVKDYSFSEIKDNKNSFFESALNALDFYNSKRNILKIELTEEQFFVIKLANKKHVHIVENFIEKEVPTEPFVYIIINNDSSVQKIAISHNSEAFSSPDVVKNILLKELDRKLEKFGLTVKIESLYHKDEVWKMIRSHKENLKSLQIKYIKPNLASISKALPEDFKHLSDDINSQESTITFKAPANGVLENVERKNSDLAGLIDYTSEGAGTVKIGIKGYRKKISSNDTPVEIGIEEATFEGQPEEVIKALREFI